ncbi:MAG: DUF5681 domain-containing protein [Alphaproteobacteria bacterium]
MSRRRNYAVGRGKPPQHTRFRPGQSGNPRGRPKGTRNLATDLEEELRRKIVIKEGNETKTVSKQQALVTSLVNNGIKGDSRALGHLLGFVARVIHHAEERGEEIALDKNDQLIIKRFMKRNSKSSPGGDNE